MPKNNRDKPSFGGWNRGMFVLSNAQIDEVVHHLDGAPENNDLLNLLLISKGEHARLHVRIRKQDRRIRSLAQEAEKLRKELEKKE